MEEIWETVYTMDDWYDGPRGGVANYRGSPHYYRSVYLDAPPWNPDEDRFELTPLTDAAFAAALELEEIHGRWLQASEAGTAPADTANEWVLPADRHRRQNLEAALEAARAGNASRAILVYGEFELGCKRVRWRPVA